MSSADIDSCGSISSSDNYLSQDIDASDRCNDGSAHCACLNFTGGDSAKGLVFDGKGFTIEGDGNDIGIFTNYTDSVVIKNVQFKNLLVGILSYSSGNNGTFTNITFVNCTYGARIESDNNTIEDSTFINVTTGVYLQYATEKAENTTIRNNTFNNINMSRDLSSSLGAFVFIPSGAGNNSVIHNNTIYGSINGVFIGSNQTRFSSNITIYDNKMHMNYSTDKCSSCTRRGVFANYSVKNLNVSENDFFLYDTNSFGLYISHIEDSVIEDNAFLTTISSSVDMVSWLFTFLDNSTVRGNNMSNLGGTTTVSYMETSYFPLNLSGNTYNQSNSSYYGMPGSVSWWNGTSDGSGSAMVTADGYNISAIADGHQNYTLILGDTDGAAEYYCKGRGNDGYCTELWGTKKLPAWGMSGCADLISGMQAAGKRIDYCRWNAFIANGTGNDYIDNLTSDFNATFNISSGYTNPLYVRHSDFSTKHNTTRFWQGCGNNFTNNIFTNSTIFTSFPYGNCDSHEKNNTIKKSNSYGSISWNMSDISVLGHMQLGKNVLIGSNYVSVNTSDDDLNESLNNTAIVTIEDVDCNKFYLYYKPGFSTSASEIISGGTKVADEAGDCSDSSICKDVSCSSGTLRFIAKQFSGFGHSGDTPTVPEWDDYAILLILVTVIGGFFAMRREE